MGKQFNRWPLTVPNAKMGTQIFLIANPQILTLIPQIQIRKFLRCVSPKIRIFARKTAMFLIKIRFSLPLIFFLPTQIAKIYGPQIATFAEGPQI